MLGAIIWNLITWFYGIPSSSSHALIGGYAGAAMAKGGLARDHLGNEVDPDALLHRDLAARRIARRIRRSWCACYWIFQAMAPARVDRFFRPAQLCSSALLSHSHGGNDAQKTMGIILGLLVVGEAANSPTQTGWLHHLYVPDCKTIPLWVKMGAYTAISLGTLFGGWRIVHTMGSRITKLRPMGGFAAETGGAHCDPARDALRDSGEHHAHDHRLDRGRGRDQPAFRGAVGNRPPDRLGVDHHDPRFSDDGGDLLLRAGESQPR